MAREKDENLKSREWSRRKFLAVSASSSVAAGLTIPIIGNAFIDDGLRRSCWDKIKDDKTTPDVGGPIVVPPEIEELLPKLEINDITYQKRTPALGNCTTRSYVIENLGKTVATSVYIEILEANRYTTPEEMALMPADLKTECFRRDIVGPIVLYPGCWKNISMTFRREFAVGQSVCICWDTVKDPRKFPGGVGVGSQPNRKLSTISYRYASASDGDGGEQCA